MITERQAVTQLNSIDAHKIAKNIIYHSDDIDDFTHQLYDCDMWFDIYGGDFYLDNSDFFETTESSFLHGMEFGIWITALHASGKIEWISELW